MNLPKPHELRVLNEHSDLTTKIESLLKFLSLPSSERKCSEEETSILYDQYHAMNEYKKILEYRIGKF
jgi:hypothetical protein